MKILLKSLTALFLLMTSHNLCATDDSTSTGHGVISVSYYPEAEITLDTYTTRTLRVIGRMENTLSPNPSVISDYRPLNFVHQLVVADTLSGPYNKAESLKTSYSDPSMNAISIHEGTIYFSHLGTGFYADNHRRGILFPNNSNSIVLRNTGNIYLQPQFSNDASDFDFASKDHVDGRINFDGTYYNSKFLFTETLDTTFPSIYFATPNDSNPLPNLGNPPASDTEGILDTTDALRIRTETHAAAGVKIKDHSGNTLMSIVGSSGLTTVKGKTIIKGELYQKGSPLVPVGTIIMYCGQTLPGGWALCNGQNGTPDLRSRYILGANSSNKYNQARRGGGQEHGHTFDPTFILDLDHTHSGTYGSIDEHSSNAMYFYGPSRSSHESDGEFHPPATPLVKTGYNSTPTNVFFKKPKASSGNTVITPDHRHQVLTRDVNFNITTATNTQEVTTDVDITRDAQQSIPHANVVYIMKIDESPVVEETEEEFSNEEQY